MIHTTLTIVIVMYVSRARHRGALEYRAKNHLTLFRCALNTETKTEGGKTKVLQCSTKTLPQQPVKRLCIWLVYTVCKYG